MTDEIIICSISVFFIIKLICEYSLKKKELDVVKHDKTIRSWGGERPNKEDCNPPKIK